MCAHSGTQSLLINCLVEFKIKFTARHIQNSFFRQVLLYIIFNLSFKVSV